MNELLILRPVLEVPDHIKAVYVWLVFLMLWGSFIYLVILEIKKIDSLIKKIRELEKK